MGTKANPPSREPAAFTPGPWRTILHADNCIDVGPLVGAEARGIVATVARWADGEAGDCDENEANATLIAAAPALFKALEQVLVIRERLKNREMSLKAHADLEAMVGIAKAALSAALGAAPGEAR